MYIYIYIYIYMFFLCSPNTERDQRLKNYAHNFFILEIFNYE